MKTRLIYSSSNGESKLMDDELKTFGIKKIVPYKWIYSSDKKIDGFWPYQLELDWKTTFYIH